MTLGKPEGPLDAPLVLVGRDYGFDEVAAGGRPFQGAAGKILNRALARAGIERGRCLVTNVVNTRPLNNKWEAHREGDIAAGLVDLESTLARHPRRIIIALGAEAFQACRGCDPRDRPETAFDGNGITELRGYVFDGPFGPVLASTHPAFILRTWLPWWPLLCWDLAKARRWVDGLGGGAVAPQETLCAPGGGPIWDDTDVMAVDIETAGEHAEIIKCVGVAFSADRGYVWKYDTEAHGDLAELLASPARKVFHNGQFDVTVLERHGFTVRNWTDDTMLLYHVIEPLIAGKSKEGQNTQKSLRFLASLLTDEPWWKNYEYETEEDRLRLCAKDARLTYAIYEALKRRLIGSETGEAHETR